MVYLHQQVGTEKREWDNSVGRDCNIRDIRLINRLVAQSVKISSQVEGGSKPRIPTHSLTVTLDYLES